MNERVIFDAALEIPDPAARQAYLDQACANNPELRSRLEALLQSHATAGDFLATPAVEQLSAKTTAVDGEAAQSSPSSENVELTLRFTPDPQGRDDEVSLGFLSPSDKPGSLGRLAHYEIHEVLGQGAFGIVLKAFDEKLHRMVAIKILSPELAKSSPPRKRFLREARSAAAIRHEHVVAIYAVEEQPIPYLAMEYIPGITLEQALTDHGPLDVPDVLRLGQQIASGLAAAHAQGLIHRDIKPSNILLENGLSGRVKISDFGLARTADDASMTQSGTIAGTPLYMSPEQASSGEIDQRSDLFSLGSVLYVMVSGRPPFRAATTLAVLKRVVEDTPRPIPEIIADVPSWLCAIIAKLQAKQPDDRFATASEVADLLGRCLADLQANRPVTLPTDMQLVEAKTVATAEPGLPLIASETSHPRTPTPPHPHTSSRRWPAIAAMLLVMLAGLGVTEATGVTKLTSTVIRLTTGSGTLVIETDDPGVKVTIDGEEVRIQGAGVEELTLKPGQYQIATVKDGKSVSQELVTITRGGREVVRVTMEGKADGVKQAATSPSELSGTAVTPPVVDASPWDLLDPAHIPASERVPGQPPELVAVLGEHRRRVWSTPKSTAVAADGSRFSLMTDDGLFVFDRDPQQPAQFVNLGNVHCKSATFLPDGRIAAFEGVPGNASVHLLIFAKPRSGTPLELQSATDVKTPQRVFCPTASSDGRWLAAYIHGERQIGLWKLGEDPPQRVASIAHDLDDLPPISFSPDAHWFCFTDFRQGRNTIQLVDLRGDTPREAAVLTADADETSDGPAKGFAHGVFLADGRLATADRNGRIWFWKLNDGDPQRVGSLRDTGSYLYAATQAARLVVSNAFAFRVWDLAVDPPRLLGASTYKFQCDNIQDQLAFAPDGQTMFTASLNGAVRFWDVSADGVTEREPLVPNPQASPHSMRRLQLVDRFVCTTQEDSLVGLWRPTRDGLQSVPDVPAYSSVLGANAAQRLLIVQDGQKGDTVLLRADGDRLTPTRSVFETGSPYYNVYSAALHDEGRRLALSRVNGTEIVLELWGWESDEHPAKKLVEVKASPFGQCVFAQGGRSLVAHNGDSISIWDLQNDQLIPRAAPPGRDEYQFAVSPDGVTLATVGYSGLKLWNLQSGLQQPTAVFENVGSHAVAFSPDGRRVAAVGFSPGSPASVVIIDLASREIVKRLPFPGPVHQIHFTDDGRHLVTGNGNGTVYVLRLESAPKTAGKQALKPTPQAADPDRAAAEWVLSVGGMIQITEHGQLRAIKAAADLPAGAWELTYVALFDNLKVTDEGLAHFKDCKNLTFLALKSTKVSDAGLAHFQDCKQLTHLYLHKTQVSDAGLAHLKDCQKLTELYLGGTQVTDAGLAYFQNCKNLTILELSATKVTDAGLAHFQDCQNLMQLHLDDCPKVTDSGLAHFKDCQNLTVLYLKSTQVTDAGLAYFQDCQNLTLLDLRVTQVTDAGLAHFQECKHLTHLYLNETQVTDAGIDDFKGLQNLTDLRLKKTKVTAAGIDELKQALPKCQIEWDGGVIEP